MVSESRFRDELVLAIINKYGNSNVSQGVQHADTTIRMEAPFCDKINVLCVPGARSIERTGNAVIGNISPCSARFLKETVMQNGICHQARNGEANGGSGRSEYTAQAMSMYLLQQSKSQYDHQAARI